MDLSNIEYVVYNGFDAVAGAFQTIGLIFSDNGYKGLFAVAAILGIVFSIMAFYVKKVSGAQLAPLAWAMPILIGVTIYIGLFVPKGTVTVYDEVTAKTQTFGNIPIGITATAGVLNKIEKGIVDIVTTTGGSSYKVAAGGIGYEALLHVLMNGYTTNIQSLDMSLKRYIEDCLFFELMRPGTNISVESIRNGTISLYDALQQSVNPSVWTVVYYNASQKNGDTKTCTDAWNVINNAIQNSQVIDSITKATCNYAGFDSSNTLEFTACKDILTNALNVTSSGLLVSYNDFMITNYIAQNIQDVAVHNGATPLSNFFMGKEQSSMAITLNQWIPIIKANLTAIIICLTPFLLIFVPTPLVSRVLPIIFGFFLWVTVWGVTDAITHQLIIQQTAKIFEKVRQNNWGYDSIMFLPDGLTKSLGLFGYMRSGGMMLATVLTGMLVKFGGTAMAMYAGNLSAVVNSTAASASGVLTPEGAARVARAQAESMGVLRGVGTTSFEERAGASQGNFVWSVAEGLGRSAAMGKVGWNQVKSSMEGNMMANLSTGLANQKALGQIGFNTMTDAKASSELYQLGRGHGLGGSAFNLGEISALMERGEKGQLQKFADRYFDGNVEAMSAWEKGGGYLTGELARKMERDLGYKEGTLEGFRMQTFSMAQDGSGRVKSGSFIRKDGQVDSEISGSQKTERGVDKRGFSYQRTVDLGTGKTVNYVGRRVASKETLTTPDGKQIRIESADVSEIGEGENAHYLYRGQINGGEGTLLTDSKGNVLAAHNVKGVEEKNVGVVNRTIKTDAGDVSFSGTEIRTSSGVAVLDGTFTTSDGKTYRGTATFKDGNLSFIDMKAGLRQRDMQSKDLPIADKQGGFTVQVGNYRREGDTWYAEAHLDSQKLNRLARSLESMGQTDQAQGLRQLAAQLSKTGGTAKVMLTGGFNSKGEHTLSTANVDHGGVVRNEDVSKDHKYSDKDHMNKLKTGGTEVTMVTPNGVKTGYLAYDSKTGKTIFVAGSERYGVDKHIVVDQPEIKDPSGKIVQPAGKVVQDVTVDPQTGKVVTGKNMSLFTTEGEIQFEGRTFKGTLVQDTRTGNKLFIDASSGNYWTATEMEDTWTMYRALSTKGNYFSSVVTEVFGKDAGMAVDSTMKGLGEVGGVIGSVKQIKSVGGKPSRPTRVSSRNPNPSSERPMLYGPDGKPIR